jgi:hypothetical protein
MRTQAYCLQINATLGRGRNLFKLFLFPQERMQAHEISTMPVCISISMSNHSIDLLEIWYGY